MDKFDATDALVRYARVVTYYCEWCKRDLIAEHGVFVHDDVFHPADWTPDGGHHDN